MKSSVRNDTHIMPSCLWMFGHHEVQLVILINIYIYCIYHYISLNCCCAHFQLTFPWPWWDLNAAVLRESSTKNRLHGMILNMQLVIQMWVSEGFSPGGSGTPRPRTRCHATPLHLREQSRAAGLRQAAHFTSHKRTQTCSEISDPGQETSMSTRGGNQSCACEVSSDSSDKPVD